MAIKKFNIFLRTKDDVVIINRVIDCLRVGNSIADITALVKVGGGYDADFECHHADLEKCQTAVREVMEREQVREQNWRLTVEEGDIQ